VEERVDIAVVGAGAAGIMASIHAARTAPGARVVALDGAKKLGAKILVAGGGRCNVTHHAVDEAQYAGSTPHAIRKVLRAWDVPQTVEFFRSLGVELKREETGKLFPTTDRASTVLDALLGAAQIAGAELRTQWRVSGISVEPAGGFAVTRDHGSDTVLARRVILASGGMALPRSGSDGQGYSFARGLGHSVTPRVVPALVPLVLEPGHWITTLSGIAGVVSLELRAGSGRKIKAFTNSMLCTHFGVSGPCAMDMSRHYTLARADDADVSLSVNWLPQETLETADAALQGLGRSTPSRLLRERGLPERLALALCSAVGVDPAAPGHTLSRERRRALAESLVRTRLPVRGDRGFTFAEVTAGGVPLSEVQLDSMRSRVCAGLHLCGEILDVDGRIGGFNFQWAWATGVLAGSGAARELI